MSQDKDNRVEFHDWHTAKENKVALKDLIEETVENVCLDAEELKSTAMLATIVELVEKKLRERFNLYPLGGPGYGRLFKTVTKMYDLPPSPL